MRGMHIQFYKKTLTIHFTGDGKANQILLSLDSNPDGAILQPSLEARQVRRAAGSRHGRAEPGTRTNRTC